MGKSPVNKKRVVRYIPYMSRVHMVPVNVMTIEMQIFFL